MALNIEPNTGLVQNALNFSVALFPRGRLGISYFSALILLLTKPLKPLDLVPLSTSSATFIHSLLAQTMSIYSSTSV